jgi:hypothetical protein
MGIRCCISSNEVTTGYLRRNLFRKFVYPGTSRFELIEQVFIVNLKCWYTKIYLGKKYKQYEGQCLNSLILDNNEEDLFKQLEASKYNNQYIQPSLPHIRRFI